MTLATISQMHRRNFRGRWGSGPPLFGVGTDPHFISTPRAWSPHFSDRSYATEQRYAIRRVTLYCSAVYAIVMCLSVCPSQAGRLLHQNKHGSTQTMPHSDQRTPVFWRHRYGWNSTGVTPNWGAKYSLGRLKLVDFDKYLATSHKRCNIGSSLLWGGVNRKSYALYPIVIFPVTMSDS